MFSCFKLLAFLWELIPSPFWANLYLYNYEYKYIIALLRTNKLGGRRFHNTFRFIDDLCALNDGCEFGKAFLEKYPTELELNVEHNGSHTTFLDLDIYIDREKFIFKACVCYFLSNFYFFTKR